MKTVPRDKGINRLDGTFLLPDGRRLGYADLGPPDGSPIFYFHGFPGSRLEALLLNPSLWRLGARVIAVDRPGAGLSDVLPGRRLLDWPGDVACLADHLGLDRFSVLGVSGGGPYAAACAYGLAERIRRAAIICGLGCLQQPGGCDGMLRFDRWALSWLARFPSLARAVCGFVRWQWQRNCEKALAGICHRLAKADQSILQRKRVRQLILRSFREALRAGGAGAAIELGIYGRCWGFDPRDIRTPVLLMHGEEDRVVPCRMGRQMAEAIPNCEAQFIPEEGHYSLPINHRNKILRALA